MSLFAKAMIGVCEQTRREFREYHLANPQVWKAFEAYGLAAMQRGKKVGSMMVINRVRWDSEIDSVGEFKVNNNYAPYYARVFNAKHGNYFDTREVREKEAA